MKKYLFPIVLSLFACLFIYVCYRTEKTLVNQLFIYLFSAEAYFSFKNAVLSALPLRDWLVYSLPEGLWVFCITITSAFFYFEVRGVRISAAFFPLLLPVVMELSQLWHFTNGRFDWMDLVFSAGFWLLGLMWARTELHQPFFSSLDTKHVCCVGTYAIVYLAHVVY